MKLWYLVMVSAESVLATLMIQKIARGEGTWFTGLATAVALAYGLYSMYRVLAQERVNIRREDGHA